MERLLPLLPLLLMLAALVIFGSTVLRAVLSTLHSIQLPF